MGISSPSVLTPPPWALFVPLVGGPSHGTWNLPPGITWPPLAKYGIFAPGHLPRPLGFVRPFSTTVSNPRCFLFAFLFVPFPPEKRIWGRRPPTDANLTPKRHVEATRERAHMCSQKTARKTKKDHQRDHVVGRTMPAFPHLLAKKKSNAEIHQVQAGGCAAEWARKMKQVQVEHTLGREREGNRDSEG